MQIPQNPKYTEIHGKLTYSLCFCAFWVWGNLHIKNQHIISGKHAQELYADFYMLPRASEVWSVTKPSRAMTSRNKHVGLSNQTPSTSWGQTYPPSDSPECVASVLEMT